MAATIISNFFFFFSKSDKCVCHFSEMIVNTVAKQNNNYTDTRITPLQPVFRCFVRIFANRRTSFHLCLPFARFFSSSSFLSFDGARRETFRERTLELRTLFGDASEKPIEIEKASSGECKGERFHFSTIIRRR